MINLLFLLCVSFAGNDNCDYSWSITDDIDSAGLYDPKTKTVYISQSDRVVEIITHEVKHIQCELMYQNDQQLDITFCNYTVDLQYTKQATYEKNTTPIPKNIMSGKMIDSLGMIGETRDYRGMMKEDRFND